MSEFETEPVRGLPENLPSGERILWQGEPDTRSFAKHVFNVNKIAIYFAVLAIWNLYSGYADGLSASAIVGSVAWMVLFGAIAVGIFWTIAHLIHRTSVYTITNKRLVMRIGVTLPITFNFPFSQILSADLKHLSNGAGSISLLLKENSKISWAVLWPHARPFSFGKPQPSLRAIGNVDAVAKLMAEQLALTHGVEVNQDWQPSELPSNGKERDRKKTAALPAGVFEASPQN